MRSKKDLAVSEENEITAISQLLHRVNGNIRSNIMLDYLDRAEKLGIYTPYSLDVSSPSTDGEVEKIRAAIREKKQQHREVVMTWAKVAGIVAAIVFGFIGALTGLAAVMRK